MSLTTLIINYHGIPLIVTGRYYPDEPEVNNHASFEIENVKARAILAGDIVPVELADEAVPATVLDYLEEEALEQIEAGFEAAAEEAADARRDARS
jgi:hypothetical protein